MPYVDRDTRFRMIEGDSPVNAGELTYALQQIIKQYLRDQGPINYAELASVLGCIEGLKADFIDQILLPYEAKKRQENGDVWTDLLS